MNTDRPLKEQIAQETTGDMVSAPPMRGAGGIQYEANSIFGSLPHTEPIGPQDRCTSRGECISHGHFIAQEGYNGEAKKDSDKEAPKLEEVYFIRDPESEYRDWHPRLGAPDHST